MFSSLIRALIKGPRGKNFSPSPGRNARSFVPSLEALEDRCLLSAATTVPAESSSFPLTGPGDMLMALLPKGNPSIAFLGDSITWGYAFGEGAPVWSATMAPLGAANYGVNGQTTQTLLYQLYLGQLVGIEPAVVVLTIGTNNLEEGDTPQATAAGVLADVNLIHQYQPQALVLVLSIPPGGANPTNPYRTEVNQTNALISQMVAGDPRARYLDIDPVFVQPDGTISNAVMADYLHPTALGYWNLTNALLPALYAPFSSPSLPAQTPPTSVSALPAP